MKFLTLQWHPRRDATWHLVTSYYGMSLKERLNNSAPPLARFVRLDCKEGALFGRYGLPAEPHRVRYTDKPPGCKECRKRWDALKAVWERGMTLEAGDILEGVGVVLPPPLPGEYFQTPTDLAERLQQKLPEAVVDRAGRKAQLRALAESDEFIQGCPLTREEARRLGAPCPNCNTQDKVRDCLRHLLQTMEDYDSHISLHGTRSLEALLDMPTKGSEEE